MKSLLITAILILSIFLNSCKKDSDNTPAAKTKEEMLTTGIWKIDELRFSQVNTSAGGATYYYKHGITANIANMDNENIQFQANNTGSYTLGAVTSPLVWSFANSEKTKMQFTITYSPTNILTVNWENVTVSETALKYSEYYTTSTGITSIGIGTRIH